MTESHTQRLEAALAARYKIRRRLGEGGMATVYLAEDLKHERNVALKILKPELAAVIGAERFLAEIKTTANLQHPHILPLFDSGEADGFLYYVMPYIDGETLAQKLARERQLGVEEAVRIARDVADALDYAHRNDVLHRDIKPGNVLLHDGRPVVADFGIAVAISAAGGGRMTETGLSLGTPHYMSPEQASADRDLSARSDIYSLGCVLYEMIAGQPPHTGPSAQSVLVRILTESPRPLTEMRHTVPPHVAAVAAKAIEKLPADRFESARDFMQALEDPAFTYRPAVHGAGTVVASVPEANRAAKTWLRDRRTWGLAGVTLVLAALGVLGGTGPRTSVGPVQRYAVDMQDLRTDPRHEVIISADGRRLAFVHRDQNFQPTIYWREVGEERFQALVEGGSSPTFSPEGDWLAYVEGVRGEGALVRMSLSGGAPRPIVPNPPAFITTPSWAPSGAIVYSADGIWTVPGTGGEPERLMEAGGWAVNPRLLPGDEALIYTDRRDQSTYLYEVGGDAPTLLVAGGVDATYVRTGHLLFVDGEGGLWAQPFDTGSLELTGDAAPILSGVSVVSSWGKYSVSNDGTMVYGLGGTGGFGSGPPDERLMVSDLSGESTMLSLAPRDIAPVKWSPDGETVAFESMGPAASREAAQIFTYNTVLEDIPRPLTLDGENENPVWSPDGTRIVFDRTADGTDGEDLFVKTFGDDTPPERIVGLPGDQQAYDWPTDDLVLFESQGRAGWDLWVYDFATDSAYPYLEAEGNQFSPTLSPGGTMLAYTEFEGGTGTLWVRSFPVARQPELVHRDFRLRVPRWDPDGNSLYVTAAATGEDGASSILLLAARLRREPSFAVTSVDTLVTGAFDPASWDLHPDGDRFIAAVPEDAGASATAAPSVEPERFVVVVNWFEELRTIVGEGNR